MKDMEDIGWIHQLSPDLFWDVQIDQVNPEKNLRWLVERVLTRGRLEDWQLLTAHVGYQRLRKVSNRLKVPDREQHFLQWVLESHHA